MKADIESLLGIRSNKPIIGSNINKGIEDLLHKKRPFACSRNNPINPTQKQGSTIPIHSTNIKQVNASVSQQDRPNTFNSNTIESIRNEKNVFKESNRSEEIVTNNDSNTRHRRHKHQKDTSNHGSDKRHHRHHHHHHHHTSKRQDNRK